MEFRNKKENPFEGIDIKSLSKKCRELQEEIRSRLKKEGMRFPLFREILQKQDLSREELVFLLATSEFSIQAVSQDPMGLKLLEAATTLTGEGLGGIGIVAHIDI